MIQFSALTSMPSLRQSHVSSAQHEPSWGEHKQCFKRHWYFHSNEVLKTGFMSPTAPIMQRPQNSFVASVMEVKKEEMGRAAPGRKKQGLFQTWPRNSPWWGAPHVSAAAWPALPGALVSSSHPRTGSEHAGLLPVAAAGPSPAFGHWER